MFILGMVLLLYANASHFIITITVNYVVILVTHLLSYE